MKEAQKKIILKNLNDNCVDTFNKGEFGPWKFTDVDCDGDNWVVYFDNNEGSDSVSFIFEGDCIDKTQRLNSDWLDTLVAAISEWEAEGF